MRLWSGLLILLVDLDGLVTLTCDESIKWVYIKYF